MEVRLNPESEARLAEIAAQKGLETNELAKEILSNYVEDQVRFVEAVKVGLAAAERGEFVEHEEVWVNVERILRS
jgi:predicted transcriptional regulator